MTAYRSSVRSGSAVGGGDDAARSEGIMTSIRRWRSASLGTRLILLLVVAVAVTLTAHSVINYRTTRRDLLRYVQSAAAQSSDLIRLATHDGMLLNRLDEVQETITRLAQEPGVAAIRVYDKQGTIVLSAHEGEISEHVNLSSDTCLSCHRRHETRDVGVLERSALARVPEGMEVLRHLSVIENQPSCVAAGCHVSPDEQRVLGVLDVEMSMVPVDATLRAAQQRVVGTTLALILVMALVTAGFVHHFVHRPVRALREGTKRVAAGHLDTRIPVRGDDEMADLARAFNVMADELGGAREELQTWSHTLERKVLEKTDELRRTQHQVMHMEKMASLGKLSATVAHELNNPLTGMLNYTRLMQRTLRETEVDGGTREEMERYLDLLQKECTRCGHIVTNLLLFARRRGAEMAPIDINDVVSRSLMLVDHHIQVNGIQLESVLIEGDPHIVGDAGQLQQAIVALLINAIEAMRAPNVEGKLSVRLSGDEPTVDIEIGDTGMGIQPDVLPHVFEPFYSTKDQESGVGLGLAVVYGIVRRHGGTIDVDSAPGQGTTFRIRLPRKPEVKEIPDGSRDSGAGLRAPGGESETAVKHG